MQLMSARVQGWVWDLEIPPQPKLILLWLANRATDAGVCFPTKRELGLRTGLSERMVRYHLEALARGYDNDGDPWQPIVTIIERRVAGDRNTSNVYVLRVPWADAETVRADLDELKHIPSLAIEGVGTTGCTQGGGDGLHPVGTTGCTQVGTTGCTQNRSLKDGHRNTPPYPPGITDQQQQGIGWNDAESVAGTCGGERASEQSPDPAEALVAAFYGGLGGVAGSLTATMRRRDLVIGRELVSAGATPEEAERYAREVSQTAGRIVPVDLRSFERERLGWLARGRCLEQTRATRYIDRTGQPASWESTLPSADLSTTPLGPPRLHTSMQCNSSNGAGQLAGRRLGEVLQAVLLRTDR
jgi:hypothetical protein